MQVIPTINCRDIACVEKRLAVVKEIGSQWVQIDISDGKFTPVVSGGIILENKEIIKEFRGLSIEAHLMVENPEEAAVEWLESGVSRIIAHCEAVTDPEFIERKCDEYGAEFMISIRPETPLIHLEPFISAGVSMVQVLSVDPGDSGQKIHPYSLKKVESLREGYPSLVIEVDGGIDEKWGRVAKEGGADIIASGNFIFGAKNPKKAYETLKSI